MPSIVSGFKQITITGLPPSKNICNSSFVVLLFGCAIHNKLSEEPSMEPIMETDNSKKFATHSYKYVIPEKYTEFFNNDCKIIFLRRQVLWLLLNFLKLKNNNTDIYYRMYQKSIVIQRVIEIAMACAPSNMEFLYARDEAAVKGKK